MTGGGEGALGFVVWPTHAGAVNAAGEEPMFDLDYARGQISWAVNEQDRLVGSVRIKVPAGAADWTHIIYTHNPSQAGYLTAQKLAHPLRLPAGGTIDLIDITDQDVAIGAPDKILHD
jgi:hypothetical protein